MSLSEVRSVLFVPGDRPERFAGALASGADCVVVDLEDAVEARAKHTARAHTAALLRQGVPPKPVFVRINHPSTRWGEDDVVALSGLPHLGGVMVPKSETSATLEGVFQRVRVALIPLIETAAGVLAAPQLASTVGVARLAFGHLDFAAELGLDPANGPLLDQVRLCLAIASSASGLPAPIDGVSSEVVNLDRVAAETRSALAAGCTARLCIHPRQIDTVHAALAPTGEEVAWARSVLTASQSAGVALVDGHMVDRPVLTRAHSIIARAAAATTTRIP